MVGKPQFHFSQQRGFRSVKALLMEPLHYRIQADQGAAGARFQALQVLAVPAGHLNLQSGRGPPHSTLCGLRTDASDAAGSHKVLPNFPAFLLVGSETGASPAPVFIKFARHVDAAAVSSAQRASGAVPQPQPHQHAGDGCGRCVGEGSRIGKQTRRTGGIE